MRNHVKYWLISDTPARHSCFDCNLIIYFQNNLNFRIAFPTYIPFLMLSCLTLKIDRLSYAALNIAAPYNNNIKAPTPLPRMLPLLKVLFPRTIFSFHPLSKHFIQLPTPTLDSQSNNLIQHTNLP